MPQIRHTTRFTLLCIGVAVTAGLLARLPYFLMTDFPLNDGGLFHEMIVAVMGDGLRFPEFVYYNGHEIPFAYPPLSFYIGGLAQVVTGASALGVVRWMPLFFNMLTVIFFVMIASRLIERRSTLLFAALVFPLVPRSYEWVIMGGGVSRSVGFFFAVLAIWQSTRIREPDDRRGWAICLLPLSLALCSHLEWGITAWTSVCLFTFIRWPERRTAAALFVIGCGMGVMTMPWWGVVLLRHGLDPFLAASATGGWDDMAFDKLVVSFHVFTLPNTWFAVAAAAGFALAVARKQWLCVAWLLLIYLVTPRHGMTPATMPVALLVALTLTELQDMAVRALRGMSSGLPGLASSRALLLKEQYGLTAVTVLTAIGTFWYMSVVTEAFHSDSALIALDAEQQRAMAWIRESTPHDASFVVLSQSDSWARDGVGEWFPVVAGRPAVSTVQGLEWVRERDFSNDWRVINGLKAVAHYNPLAVPTVVARLYDSKHGYAAVFSEPDHPIFEGFRNTNLYEPIYRTESVTIYRRTEVLAQR